MNIPSRVASLAIFIGILTFPSHVLAADQCDGLRLRVKQLEWHDKDLHAALKKTPPSQSDYLLKQISRNYDDLAAARKQLEKCEAELRRSLQSEKSKPAPAGGGQTTKVTPPKPSYIDRDDKRNIQYTDQEREKMRKQREADQAVQDEAMRRQKQDPQWRREKQRVSEEAKLREEKERKSEASEIVGTWVRLSSVPGVTRKYVVKFFPGGEFQSTASLNGRSDPNLIYKSTYGKLTAGTGKPWSCTVSGRSKWTFIGNHKFDTAKHTKTISGDDRFINGRAYMGLDDPDVKIYWIVSGRSVTKGVMVYQKQ